MHGRILLLLPDGGRGFAMVSGLFTERRCWFRQTQLKTWAARNR